MRPNKANQLVLKVQNVLKFYGRSYIKSVIGDSTNNHRTVSVNQLVRFLAIFNPTLSAQVNTIYLSVREDIAFGYRTNYRNDAIDSYEFLSYLEEHLENPKSVRKIGRLLSKVA